MQEHYNAHDPHGHPSARRYVEIAVILAVITAIEVGTYYVQHQLGGLMVPILLVLSVAKFALVAMYFMHLKFDSKLLGWLFVAGIFLAAAVFIALLTDPLSALIHPANRPNG